MILPVITITDFRDLSTPIAKRKVVIITARVHPSECSGSWMMEGFLRTIMKDNSKMNLLRKNIIFKIMPMLNPDGVVLGNFRTSLSGRDLNRQYKSLGNRLMIPEILGLIKLIRSYKNPITNRILGYFDLHGHGKRKGIFCYGPDLPKSQLDHYKARMIPRLISKFDKLGMFKYWGCSFKDNSKKLCVARVHFQRTYKIMISYTIEASISSYLKTRTEDVPFLSEMYLEMGSYIVEAINMYNKIIN